MTTGYNHGMTREEYQRLIDLAAGLFNVEPTPRTVEAWWPEMRDFCLADAEDAMHRLARSIDKWPPLARVIAETRSVARGRPRLRVARHVMSEAERERQIRYGRAVTRASELGCLAEMRRAMLDADRLHGDSLAAAEAIVATREPTPA